MNIYFQSGEFLNDAGLLPTILEITASLVGALLSAAIAIWIFNKGHKKQVLFEKQKEDQRLTGVKVYFETSVRSLIDEPIEKQWNEILRFTGTLKEKKFQHYEMQSFVSLTLEYIKKVEHKDLFTIYVAGPNINERTKVLHLLVTELDAIAGIRENLAEYFNAFLDDFKRYQGDFETNANDFIKLFTQEITAALAQGQLAQDHFLSAIRHQFQIWQSLQNSPAIDNHRDPYLVNQHLLTPILALCSGNQNDRRAPMVANYIRNAQFALENFDELRTFFRKAFLISARRLIRARVRISGYLQSLTNGTGT